MAGPRGKVERKRWKYFFYGGYLHQMLGINRGTDEISAWNFELQSKRLYSWLAVKRDGEPALTYTEVGRIFNRANRTIRDYIDRGFIEHPQMAYSLKSGRPLHYMMSKKQVYEMYDAITQIHFGRPRKDGFIQNRKIPDLNEVRSALESDLFMYAKKGDGEFVPIWKTEEW